MDLKKLFRNQGSKTVALAEKELEILKRETEESQKSAMPDNLGTDAFGGGNYVTSKLRLAVNQNGLLGIVSRRIFEPRKALPKQNREEI